MAGCDNCGAPMRIDRARGLFMCAHCDSQVETPALLEHLEVVDETSRACPTCDRPLSTARLEGYPLLWCARCSGMLIEMEMFAALIDAARACEAGVRRIALPRRQNPGDRLLNCPACGQPMFSHLYDGPGNVVIESCEHCRVNWLDPGELRRITVAPDSPNPAR